MRGANNPSGSQRFYESGLVWVELITNNTGSINVPEYSTIRVRAVAPCTVTLDNETNTNPELACTLAINEVIRVCVGPYKNLRDKSVTVIIAGGAAYVSVGKE